MNLEQEVAWRTQARQAELSYQEAIKAARESFEIEAARVGVAWGEHAYAITSRTRYLPLLWDTLSIHLLRRAIGDLTVGKRRPQLLLGHPTTYEDVIDLMAPQQRFMSTELDSQGFANILIAGVPLVPLYGHWGYGYKKLLVLDLKNHEIEAVLYRKEDEAEVVSRHAA